MTVQCASRLAIAALSALAVAAASLAAKAGQEDGLRLDPKDIAALASQHGGVGTSGVEGIRTTLLLGDPAAPSPYTIALSVPAHTIIAAHTHRDSRVAVVVSGTWWFGYGAANAEAALKPLPPGSFYVEPAGVAHFARTGDQPVVVYITGTGPSDTSYVERAKAAAGN